MTVPAKYAAYDKEGKRVDGGVLHLPEYLDWMPIDVKVEYFKHIGQGPESSKYIVFASQGEEKLIPHVRLRTLRHVEYKERSESAQAHIDNFITEGGYSREPRNQ